MGSRKCGAFLSSWGRDSHPTCTRCRGRVCTRVMTYDFCVGWSPSQWEAFAKKRAYKHRKRSSRPSGTLPTAMVTSPRAGTSSEVLRPEASSSSSSLPSGGQAKREGSRDAPCAASREASSFPARPRSSERGGSVLWSLVRCERTRFCLLGSFGSWEGGSCSSTADFPCPRLFLGCLALLITARSATW